MTFNNFKESLLKDIAPTGISGYLRSLWYDAKGDWDKAHHIIQDMEDKTAAWIHAYLHRKEGDIANADYWYHRAGRKRPTGNPVEEWELLVKELLND